jgi:hypothetical protein
MSTTSNLYILYHTVVAKNSMKNTNPVPALTTYKNPINANIIDTASHPMHRITIWIPYHGQTIILMEMMSLFSLPASRQLHQGFSKWNHRGHWCISCKKALERKEWGHRKETRYNLLSWILGQSMLSCWAPNSINQEVVMGIWRMI